MQPEVDLSLAGKDLRGQDLRHKDLSNKVLFGTDLRGANLYGAHISLLCQTFDGVRLDDQQVAFLLLMLSQADIDPEDQAGLKSLARSVVGEEKYNTLLRMLRII